MGKWQWWQVEENTISWKVQIFQQKCTNREDWMCKVEMKAKITMQAVKQNEEFKLYEYGNKKEIGETLYIKCYVIWM